MPIYAYKCESCGHRQDVLQKMSDPLLTLCPSCGAAAFSKQVTAAGFQLKGSGWYVTDFRNGSTAAKPAEGGASAEGGAAAPAAAPASADTTAGKSSEATAAAPAASPAPAAAAPAVAAPSSASAAKGAAGKAPPSGG